MKYRVGGKKAALPTGSKRDSVKEKRNEGTNISN